MWQTWVAVISRCSHITIGKWIFFHVSQVTQTQVIICNIGNLVSNNINAILLIFTAKFSSKYPFKHHQNWIYLTEREKCTSHVCLQSLIKDVKFGGETSEMTTISRNLLQFIPPRWLMKNLILFNRVDYLLKLFLFVV